MKGDLMRRSLEELEEDRWGDAPDGATDLMQRAHRLRTVPIGALQVEDLRLLIGQRIGLGTLVPLALGLLRDRPLLEGDFYPGDLLDAVRRVPHAWWLEHPSDRALLDEILTG